MRFKCLECGQITHIEDDIVPKDYEKDDAISSWCPRCDKQQYLVAATPEVSKVSS